MRNQTGVSTSDNRDIDLNGVSLLPCHLFGVYHKPKTLPSWEVRQCSSGELAQNLAVPVSQRTVGVVRGLAKKMPLVRNCWRRLVGSQDK
jgi:hypothetical protein